MPQFPLLLNEGDLVDAARGRPDMTDGHGDRGGAEGGRWVRSLPRPSPVPDRMGPGSGHPRAVMGTSLARGTRSAGGTPVFPGPLLGVAAHKEQNIAGGEWRAADLHGGGSGQRTWQRQ